MSRDRLPLPIRRVLREPLDDAALETARRALESARRETPLRETARRETARRRPRAIGRLVATVAAVAACALALAIAGPALRPQPGPLHLASGGALPDALASGAHDLDDGSTLALAPATVLQTLANDARDVSFLLDRGRATFDVRPGGLRRWTIECGLATVVVLGTRFTLDRSAERLRVEVERGAVLVRGEQVPDGARRLGAGDVLDVIAERVSAETPPPPPPEIPADVPEEPSASPSPRAVERWRSLAARGAWPAAYDALGAPGVRREAARASVDDLMLLADVARLSGHPEDAIAPLERVVAEHRADPHAALAAMSLGRIEDRLGRPDRAARAFAMALELGVPRDLRPDALARRATAHRDAGDTRAARAAAERYLAELPDGPHAAAMRAIEGAR